MKIRNGPAKRDCFEIYFRIGKNAKPEKDHQIVFSSFELSVLKDTSSLSFGVSSRVQHKNVPDVASDTEVRTGTPSGVRRDHRATTTLRDALHFMFAAIQSSSREVTL